MSTITSLPTANSIDGAADYLAIDTASAGATQKINRNTLLGLASAPVGLTDNQTLTNKTLTSPTISGPTLSGTVTGTYTLGGTPTFPSTVVTTTGSQTLTNKVLTSPTISGPTITNATLSADAITGYTTSNTGTIYGISVTTGTIGSAALGANSVTTSAVTNASITASKLNLGPAAAIVATSETTTSTTYTDLATTTDTVTVTIGANGLALVSISCESFPSATGTTYMSFALSGANTQSANNNLSIAQSPANSNNTVGAVFLLTGLTAGSTTFKAKYQVGGSVTGTFINRRIAVVPL